MVAVRRLDLALRVSAAVDERQLAEGWAAAFEAALAGLLARTPAGDDDDASVVWFADAWAAEGRHLQRRAAGLPDAWWAQDLADAGSHLAAADTPDGLEALTILLRWLARDPPAPSPPSPRWPAATHASPPPRRRRGTHPHPPPAGLFAGSANAQLPSAGWWKARRPSPPDNWSRPSSALSSCAPLLAALGTTSGPSHAQAIAAPWLLAALFAGQPTLTRLPPARSSLPSCAGCSGHRRPPARQPMRAAAARALRGPTGPTRQRARHPPPATKPTLEACSCCCGRWPG
jgi:hypothetical protein